MTGFFFRDPNGDKVPEWPSYDVSSKRYAILDTQITTGENLKAEATELLSKIMEKGRQKLGHNSFISSSCTSNKLSVNVLYLICILFLCFA
jgi:hypothetical protein